MLQVFQRKWTGQGWKRSGQAFLMAIVFLGIVYVVAYHDCDWTHLWLPASLHNDEVMYNRQLAGVLAYGWPRGYFGYNETHAAVGNFGAWGPVLIYLYAIPGILVGSGVNTLFWCNVLFAILGWTVFVTGTRLSWKRQAAFAIGIVCAWQPVRLIFSGLSEGSQFALVLIVLGGCAALSRGAGMPWFGVVVIACIITTITRAYTAFLWIFPVVLLWKSHRRWSVACMGLGTASVIGYLWVKNLFTAPFFSGGGVDLTVVEMFLQGHYAGAFLFLGQRIGTEWNVLWTEYLKPTITGNLQDQGSAFLTMIFLALLVFVSLLCDRMHGKPVLFKACALIYTAMFTVAMMGMYTVETAHRHCSLVNVLLLAVLMYESVFSLVGCLPLLLLFHMNTAYQALPTYKAHVDEQIQVVQTALLERVRYQKEGNPWDCTLAYCFGEGPFHGYLYAVAGMGIEFDNNTYLADPANPIYSRYAMVNHGTDAEARLLADGWQELVSTKDLVVYERPEAGQ